MLSDRYDIVRARRGGTWFPSRPSLVTDAVHVLLGCIAEGIVTVVLSTYESSGATVGQRSHVRRYTMDII